MNPELIESESFRIVQEGLRKKGQEASFKGRRGPFWPGLSMPRPISRLLTRC